MVTCTLHSDHVRHNVHCTHISEMRRSGSSNRRGRARVAYCIVCAHTMDHITTYRRRHRLATDRHPVATAAMHRWLRLPADRRDRVHRSTQKHNTVVHDWLRLPANRGGAATVFDTKAQDGIDDAAGGRRVPWWIFSITLPETMLFQWAAARAAGATRGHNNSAQSAWITRRTDRPSKL